MANSLPRSPEGKIVSWVESQRDILSKDESFVEPDKADMDVETFYDGIPAEAKAKAASLLLLEEVGKLVSIPAAKKLVKQRKVDLNKIAGTGTFCGLTPPVDVEAAEGIILRLMLQRR
ncbi:hypothetical protein MLD38_011428 [Melastoma candidum]|uniref:Uncharacterized protein n=1 Tax=Melastoma candidum TaxID=119954 RepID=A0ACB9R343_9MYRT|nr:hypothetical protein MLD38_011428 [Melastoma candidum]